MDYDSHSTNVGAELLCKLKTKQWNIAWRKENLRENNEIWTKNKKKRERIIYYYFLNPFGVQHNAINKYKLLQSALQSP